MFRLILFLSSIIVVGANSFEERLKLLENIVAHQQVEMDLLKRENIELKDRIQELKLDVSRLTNENDLPGRNFATDQTNPDMHGNGHIGNTSSIWNTRSGDDSFNMKNTNTLNQKTMLNLVKSKILYHLCQYN